MPLIVLMCCMCGFALIREENNWTRHTTSKAAFQIIFCVFFGRVRPFSKGGLQFMDNRLVVTTNVII